MINIVYVDLRDTKYRIERVNGFVYAVASDEFQPENFSKMRGRVLLLLSIKTFCLTSPVLGISVRRSAISNIGQRCGVVAMRSNIATNEHPKKHHNYLKKDRYYRAKALKPESK